MRLRPNLTWYKARLVIRYPLGVISLVCSNSRDILNPWHMYRAVLGKLALLSIWNQSIVSTRKVNTVTFFLAIPSKVSSSPALTHPTWLWWLG